MDALDGLFREMRLTGAVFLDAEFTAPWCIAAKVGPEDCKPFMQVPAQLIAYHYILEGRLLLCLEGQDPTEASAHDLLIFPRNDAHILTSKPGLRPVPVDDLIEPPGEDGLARIRYGGGGAACRVLCGFLASRDRSDPLIASLPPVLKVSAQADGMGAWVEQSIRYAANSLAVPSSGAASSLARVAELLFAEAVREYLKGLPESAKGWLAGLRDPYVGRAIALMHEQLLRRWQLDELAREVGLSRSALSARFQNALGTPPMRYLSLRRLNQAAERLRTSGTPITQIAYETGYESEAAFAHSFKREFGCSPAAFRRTARNI